MRASWPRGFRNGGAYGLAAAAPSGGSLNRDESLESENPNCAGGSHMITDPQLARIALALTPEQRDVYLAALNPALNEFDINTPLRQAAFLAQTPHESQNFTRLVENVRYSAKRLTEVWPKRFPTWEKAKP